MRIDQCDRRRAPRRVPDPSTPLARVRLRTGREMTVIDVSRLGVLVEGHTRLLPGTHLDVHVTGAQGRVLVRARVVRSLIWVLTADLVEYRAGLAFGVLLDLDPGEEEPPVAVGGSGEAAVGPLWSRFRDQVTDGPA